MYLYQYKNWTDFRWDESLVATKLEAIRFAQGRLAGKAEIAQADTKNALELMSLSDEVIASSAIEGVRLDEDVVRSSVAKRMGIDLPETIKNTHDVDGIVDIMFDATDNAERPLTQERLLGWHNSLFPTGYSGLHKIHVAEFRTEPMQVLSGPIGHEHIHYEAVPACEIPHDMAEFLEWLNAENVHALPLKAAIAHLWFLTIHPFDDGNGRIARALTEFLLAISADENGRLYSMASYIMRHRESYYDALEHAQKGDADITEWIIWFLDALHESIEEAIRSMDAALADQRFWESIDGIVLNERQRSMLLRLRGDFEGKLTAAKWAKMCKVSPDTALRDINDLIAKDILERTPDGGRNTSYRLCEIS